MAAASPPPSIGGLDACSRVKRSAELVLRLAGEEAALAINGVKLDELATEIARRFSGAKVDWDASGWHFSADAAESGPLTAQYVFVLDALNFCFWPSKTGMEYEELATCLKRVLEADASALSAESLSTLNAATLRGWFAPNDVPNVEERVSKLNELGQVLATHFDGQAANMVSAAKGSAPALVELIVRYLPGFRDETVYRGRQVCFYKRAQICVADVWASYGQKTDESAFAMRGIEALTMFADYRVPQILRSLGVLDYGAELAAAVDGQQQLPAGGSQEVEIRAATVLAVERLRDALATRGSKLTAVEVDWWLWQQGEAARDTLAPHHKCLTPFY